MLVRRSKRIRGVPVTPLMAPAEPPPSHGPSSDEWESEGDGVGANAGGASEGEEDASDVKDVKEEPGARSSRNQRRRTQTFMLRDLPMELKMQLRVSILVYGPFAAPEVVRRFCFSDYVELCREGESPVVEFDEYHKHFLDVVHKFRATASDAVIKIFKNSQNAGICPKLPTNVAATELRSLAFNQRWMLEASHHGSSSSESRALHPFLADVVRLNSVAAINEYIERINARMVQTKGAGAKVVTLHQLAPLIVIAIATFANVGIASHLGIDRYQLGPLQQLYNEALASLNDPNGALGQQFTDDSCALLDRLLHGRMSTNKLREITRDVPRDTDSGLPIVAFAKHERK
ncbi:hypothetical protein H9P43_006247 [Blastocladiella emersonii ATCC 22665]|nr:hypothetical protein H9P43_006247 [Blastocladiella emersonii ATCC 22665]